MVPTELEGLEVKLYRPQDGDILVIHTDREITADQYDRAAEWFKNFMPGGRVIILQPGMKLDVVRQV